MSEQTLADTLTLNFTSPSGHHIDMTAADLVQMRVPEGEVLTGFKGQLCAQLDAHAERLRLGIITPGAGQALEYQEAQVQAAAALKAASSATAEKYPMLAATVGIDIDPETGKPATDVLGVARSVQAARGVWVKMGPAIRTARRKAKAQIRAAASLEDAEHAYLAVCWPEQSAAD